MGRESGVPQRTVYRYFVSKEALFGAFWRWVNDTIAMPAAPTTPAEVVDHIPALFAAFDRDETLVRAMLHSDYGRAVRLAHTEARREKFRLALQPVTDALPPEAARNLLAAVTVLCSASGWETFWRLRAPRAIPLLFASLRIASTTSIIGAIVGEWIGSNQGLGAVIIQSTFNYQAERLFAAVTLASLSGLLFFAIVCLVERRFQRFNPA